MGQELPSDHLYGKTLRRREVAGFLLVETAYLPGLRLPRHSHELAGFCFVLQGSVERFYDANSRVCGPSGLSFIPSGEKHSERFSDAGARLFSIQIVPRWLEHVRDYTSVPDAPAVFGGEVISQLMTRLYAESRRRDEASPLAVEGLALEIMAEASRGCAPAERGPTPWLEQSRELLHERFAETLSLADVAREVRVHPVHLARAFRRHYHRTVGEYVRHLRVEFARRELSATGMPLSEIALRAGFSSQSHFSTVFKRHTGMTPVEYRAAFRPR